MDSSVLCQYPFPVKTGKEPNFWLSDKVKKMENLILLDQRKDMPAYTSGMAHWKQICRNKPVPTLLEFAGRFIHVSFVGVRWFCF